MTILTTICLVEELFMKKEIMPMLQTFKLYNTLLYFYIVIIIKSQSKLIVKILNFYPKNIYLLILIIIKELILLSSNPSKEI